MLDNQMPVPPLDMVMPDVINSGRGLGATYPAAIVSFGISLLMTYMVGVKVCKPAAADQSAAAMPRFSHS